MCDKFISPNVFRIFATDNQKKAEMILEKEEIKLPEQQLKLVTAGWGNETVEETAVSSIVYNSDGLKVKGYVAYPKDQSKKYPCIIWNRGGARKRGVIDEFNARGVFGKIASWGYVVFASMYRGSIKGEGCDMFGGEDVNDVLILIPLADEIPAADKNSWGIEGWSRGGLMTYLTLLRSNIFKAAVTTGGISDLGKIYHANKLFHTYYTDFFKGKELNEELSKRSPIESAEKFPKGTNYLIMHGGKDETVPPNQSFHLGEKLTEYGYNTRLVIFEGGDHYLKRHRKETETLREYWYKKYLG